MRDISQELRFADRLRARANERRTWLCLGLDPVPERFPAGVSTDASGMVEFCKGIVEATSHLVAAFKINFAFFEALGAAGWTALREVRDAIPSNVPVIADAKRGDIPSTSEAYARAVFDVMGFDAVTVSPYLGWDAVAPFAARPGKGVFVLCKTSNPGSGAFQNLLVDGEPLYLHVARGLVSTGADADLGPVVGATDPAALRAVRGLSPDTLILVPGVGTQGASGLEALTCGANERGENALVTVSRDILYASAGSDFTDAARAAAERRARELWKG